MVPTTEHIGKEAYYSKPTRSGWWWEPKTVTILAIGQPGIHQRIKVLCDGKEIWVTARRVTYPHPDTTNQGETE